VTALTPSVISLAVSGVSTKYCDHGQEKLLQSLSVTPNIKFEFEGYTLEQSVQ